MNLKKLRRLRKEKKLTIAAMSEVMGYKSQATYWKKEHGNISISLLEAEKISAVLGKSVDEIFFSN